MRPYCAWRAPLLLVAALALAACAPSTLRRPGSAELAAQQSREDAVRAQPQWGLVGRIAFDDGRETGSGRIEWREDDGRFEILLSAPVSRRSWRLAGAPGYARLDGLEGGPRIGSSAEDLLADEVGWTVPLRQLRAWARGLRGDPRARLGLDEGAGAGALPAQIEEDGWTIRYRDWFAEYNPPLPRRVFAEQGERHVRLVVERWLEPGQARLPDDGRADARGAGR